MGGGGGAESRQHRAHGRGTAWIGSQFFTENTLGKLLMPNCLITWKETCETQREFVKSTKRAEAEFKPPNLYV